MPPPRIALLCATRRGLACARRLLALRPDAEFALCSFPEEPWEPRYLEDIRALATQAGQRFAVARQVCATDLFEGEPFDLLLAVSWRYIVRPDVYQRAWQGAFVFHDSLLPRRRGFAPTPWAMIEGDRATGATLLEMAEAVDRGPIIDQTEVPIGPDEYIDSVLARVTEAYLRLLEKNLPALLAGTAPRSVQNEAEATYGRKRRPEDNRLDWNAAATSVFNLIRACSAPYPGAFCERARQRLTIWKADAPETSPQIAHDTPGRIVERLPGRGARVALRDGTLVLREVQFGDQTAARADEVLQAGDVLT